MVFSSLLRGIRSVWTYRRVVLLFYLANLLAAFLVMYPFRAVLGKFAGWSLMGKFLAGRLDMDFFFELLKYRQEVFPALFGLLMVVAVLYWIAELFLSAGAFGVLLQGEGYSSPLFWRSAGTYFFRFVRIVLWGIPVFIAFYLIQFIEVGGQRLLFGRDPYQNVLYWGRWIRIGLQFLGFILWLMVLDYARIIAVATEERRMRVVVWQALRFVFGHFGKTFLLAFLLYAGGILVGLAYQPVSNALSAPSSVTIGLLFIVQQLYMMFRMALRVARFSSQAVLYQKMAGT
jgi:hypothetical protein